MEIIPLKLGMVNAYLVKTEAGSFLIDTGLPMSRTKLEKAIVKQGVAPADIKLVIITHGDIDHIGNCAYLQKQYGCRIAVHEADAFLCRTGKPIANRKRKTPPYKRLLRMIVFKLIYKPVMKKYPLETFEPDIILNDGLEFSKEGFDARVIHIPGHSMGSIGILTAENDFFSGDTMLNRKKPTFAEIVEDESSLVSSIEKIKNLNIRNVYPGHGKPFPMSELKF